MINAELKKLFYIHRSYFIVSYKFQIKIIFSIRVIRLIRVLFLLYLFHFLLQHVEPFPRLNGF